MKHFNFLKRLLLTLGLVFMLFGVANAQTQSLPFTDGFESTLNAWSFSGAITPDTTIDQSYEGSQSLELIGENTLGDALATISFNASTGIPRISFAYYIDYYYYSDFSVEIQEAGSSSWTMIYEFTGGSSDDEAWIYEELYLGAYNTTSGSFKIRFNAENTSSYGDQIYVDDFEIIDNSCPPPTGLTVSSLTTTSADLSWTTGSATNWNLEWGATGFTQGSGTLLTNVSNPYSLTGLTASTGYEFYVQDSCGLGNVSSWAGPFAFTTYAPTQTLAFTDGFESTLNAWSFSGTVTSATTTDQSYEGSQSLELIGENTLGNALATIVFNASTGIPRISFAYYIDYYYYSEFSVEIQEAGSSSWTMIYEFTGGSSDDAAWIYEELYLGAYNTTSGSFKIRLNAENTSSYGDQIYVDDFEIIDVTCLPSTNLAVSNLTTTSADLSWTTGGASNWNIEWGTAGFTQGSGTMLTNVSNPYSLTSLTANTGYEFYVQDSCGLGDVSTWAGPYTFTTYAPAQTLPFTDGFETDLSAWLLGGGSIPSFSTSFVKSGTNSVNMISDGSSTGSMTIQFNPATDPRLSVSYYIEYYTYHDFTIEIQEAGSATWTEIHSFDSEYGTSGDDDIWIDIVEMDLAAYDTESGVFKIRLNGITTYSSNYYKIYVDDFYIYEPSQNDMAALEIVALVSGIEYTTAQDVSVKYENKGVAAQSNIPIMYSVDGGTTIVTETIAGPIAPDSIGVYTFTQKATLVSGVNYCGAVVSNPGDTINDNDTVFAEIYNYAMPYANDFEGETDGEMPEGWIYINTVSPSSYVEVYDGTYSYEGDKSLHFYELSTTGDLIAIIPPYQGSTLTDKWLEMQVRGEDDSPLIIGVLTDPTDANTFVGVDTIIPPDESYQNYIISFANYSGSGKYIGLKHGLETTYDDFYIDNLKLYQPPANNLAIVDIVAPISAIDNGAQQDFIIRITNQGSASQSNIPVKYSIDGGTTIVTETFAGPINTFDTVSFTFTQKASLAAGVNYCAAVVSNPGDTINDNDTAFAEIYNYTLPYYNDFENETSSELPENWSYIETYSSAYAYAYSGSSYAFEGNMSLKMYCSYASTSDDIIAILPRFAGTTLTDKWLSMAVRGQDDSPLIIGVLDDPNDETTFTGVDTIIPPDESYAEYIIQFTSYTGSGKYIGLKHGRETTADYIYIDNLKLYLPPTNDVEVVQFLGNYGGLDVTSTDTVRVIVRNKGTAAQTSIPMKYSLDNGNVISETMTSLAVLTTDTFTFATTYDATTSGQHTLVAYSDLSNDGDNINDTATTSFITNEVMTVPSSYDFLTATDLHFKFNQETYSSAGISADANYNQGNGIKLEGGSSSTGWSSYSTVTQAFANTTHVSSVDAMVDASGISYLFIDFDFKSYCLYYSSKYTWFRVLINGTDYAKTLEGDSVWVSGSTSSDPWQTIKLDLSQYAGTTFSISFQGALKYNEAYSSPGNKIYIDNINLYVPPANDVAIVNYLGNYGGLNVTATDTVSVLVKNNGTSAQTSIPINYKLDNGTVVSETMPSLAAFTTDTFTFAATYDATVGGNHSLMVYTSLSGDEDNTNDTMTKAFITYGTHIIPFTEDFEAGYTYFDNDNVNNVDFIDDTVLFHTGSHSVKNAHTSNNENMLHEAGVLDLTSSTNPVLDFWHIAKTEGGYDKSYIEISTDNGQSYIALDDSLYLGESSNYAVKGYFHEDSYSEWGTGTQTPDNSWWKMERFNLEPFKDDSVRVRFRIDSDGSVQRDGWSLDDITVQEEPAAVAALGNDTAICSGENIILEAGSTTAVGYSYLWTANGDTISNTSYMMDTDSAGTYTVEVTGLANTAYDTVIVSVNPLPTAAIAGDATICAGDSTMVNVNFTGTAPWNFDVSDGTNTFTDSSTTSSFQPYAGPSDTTYYTIISITDGNGCIQTMHSDTITINVNQLPTITTTLLSDVCVNASPITLGFATPAGGTYSGVGVSAGIFDPATAGVGNHYIKYEYTDGNTCVNSDSVLINVNALPTISFATLNDVCIDAASFALSGATPAGGTWSGPGVDASANFDPATAGAGTHYIKYEFVDANSCWNIDSTTITVNPLPVIAASATPNPVNYGTTSSLDVSVGSSTYSYLWSPADSLQNVADANIKNPTTKNLSLLTTFTVQVTDNVTACSQSDNVVISITGGPLTTTPIAAHDTLCVGDSTTLSAQPSGGNGTYTYSWTSNPAGFTSTDENPKVQVNEATWFIVAVNDGFNTVTDSVEVGSWALPTIGFTAMNDLCVDASAINLSAASPVGGIYSGVGVSSGDFDPVTAGVGTHYIKYEYTDGNGCYNIDSSTIIVNDLPIITTTAVNDICVDASPISLGFASPIGGTYSGLGVSSGDFDPAIAGVGAHFITYTYTDGNSCVNSDSVEITVNDLPAISIPSMSDVCVDAASFALTGATPTGGTWSGTGVDASANFDPATAGVGTHYIKYEYTDANTCYNIDSVAITVNALPVITFTAFADICVDASSLSLNNASPIGGTYSGVGVSSGSFDPSVAGVGTHYIVYAYTDGNGCYSIDSTTITVNALPIISTTSLSDVCVDAAPITLGFASPTGGTYSGLGVSSGSFDPAIAGSGTHYIIYTYTDGNSCANSDSVAIVVNPLPVISIPAMSDVCVDAASFALTGATPAAGTWSGIGVASGNFDPATAGVGTHYIKYEYTDANTCYSVDSVAINVNALPVLSFTTLADVCVDASSFALTGATPSGGTWSGLGVDASGNFDPSVAGAGTHYLKYAYTDGNGCYSIDSTTILVNALPVLSISNLDSEYCSNGIGSTLIGSPVGGTFAGDGITGNYFDPTVATIGNVQISYTYTDANSCSNIEYAMTDVLPLPNYSLTSDTVICETGALLLDPMSDTLNNFVWSTGDSTPTITIDTTGFGIGIFTINYSITDTNNCTIADSIDVEFEAMPAEITVDTVDICGQDQIINLQAAAGNYNYLWSTGDTTAQITIDTAIAGTSYFTVNVSVSGKACVMNDSVEVIFYPSAIVDLGNDTSLCINWTYDLDAGSGYDYLWTDGSTNQVYTFDAKDAGLGYHTVGVTVTSPDGCIADDDLMIKVDPCTGIEDLNANSNINVYPNPTDGQFTVSIDGIDGDVRMQLLSSEGKMLFNEEFKVNNSLIKDFDASTFAKGVYYIRIMTNEQTQVYKVIIQ